MKIFYCTSYMDCHLMSASSPCKHAFLPLYVCCCGLVTGILLFIMRSGFVLLNAPWREFCHIANELIIWKLNSMSKHFPCSQLLNLIFPSHKMRYPAYARVAPFPVNRTLRVFSCFHLANNTLKPVNCLRQRPVSFVFKLTYFLLHFF